MTEEMLVCPDCGLSADLVREAAATEFPEPDDADSHLHGFPEGPAEVPPGHPEAPVPSEFDSVKHNHPWAEIQRCPDCGAGATVCRNGFHGETPAVYPLPHSDTASWDRDALKWIEPDDTISSGTPKAAPGGKPLMEMGDIPKTKKKIQDLKGQGIDMANMVYRQTVTDPDTGFQSHHVHENLKDAEDKHAEAQQRGFLSELVPTLRDHPMHNDAFHELHGRPTPGIQSSKTASCEDDWCPLFQIDAAWETPIPRNDGQCLCGHPNDMHDDSGKCSGYECQCQVLRTKTAAWETPIPRNDGQCLCGHPNDMHDETEKCSGAECQCQVLRTKTAHHDNDKEWDNICPDCGNGWSGGPRCPTCGLDTEDLEAAGEFYDRMKNKASRVGGVVPMTTTCPECSGPVQVWADPSEGVTINFACDNDKCRSGKPPWDTPRPVASKTAADQAPCPECHTTGMCDCGGADRDCDKCGGSGICPRCHGEMIITPEGAKIPHSKRVAARVEPEELQPGNKVMAHFHCNCGIDHTPQSQPLTYVGAKDENGQTRHTFKTGDYNPPDPRSDQNDYDFDVYKFNNEDNWGDYWAYGSDADPVTFHTAKLAAETVIQGPDHIEQVHGKCVKCGKKAVMGDSFHFGNDDWACTGCAPLVGQNGVDYYKHLTASHDIKAERDLVMNYLYENDWDTFEVISQNEGFCTTCGGSGDAPGGNGMPCRGCGGTGREGGNTRCLNCDGGNLPDGSPCPFCKGTGHSDLATHPRAAAAESCIHGMDPNNCFDCQNPKAKAPTDIPNAEPGARGTGMRLRDWERKLLEKGAGTETCIHGIDPENCFDCNNPKAKAPTDIPNAEPGARGTGMKLRDWERKLLEKGAAQAGVGQDVIKALPGMIPGVALMLNKTQAREYARHVTGLHRSEPVNECPMCNPSEHTGAIGDSVTAPADGMIGVLYGDDGDTYQSVDGGMTWDKVGAAPDPTTCATCSAPVWQHSPDCQYCGAGTCKKHAVQVGWDDWACPNCAGPEDSQKQAGQVSTASDSVLCPDCHGEGEDLWVSNPEGDPRAEREGPPYPKCGTCGGFGFLAHTFDNDPSHFEPEGGFDPNNWPADMCMRCGHHRDADLHAQRTAGFADMVTKGLDAVDEAVTSKCSGGCGCQTGQCKCANCSGSLNKPQAQPGVVE